MRDDHDAALVVQDVVFDELENLPSRFPVQGGRRFVEDQQIRSAHDRARDGDALLLASAQLDRRELRAVFESDDVRGISPRLRAIRPSRAS